MTTQTLEHKLINLCAWCKETQRLPSGIYIYIGREQYDMLHERFELFEKMGIKSTYAISHGMCPQCYANEYIRGER